MRRHAPIALSLAVALAFVVAGAGASRRQRITETVSRPTMTTDKAEGHKGGLTIAATAVVGEKYEPEELYWYLRVSRRQAGEWQAVWGQDYDHQTFFTRPGFERTVTFREDLMLPPGWYYLEIGVKEVQRSDVDDRVRITTAVSNVERVHVD